MKYVSWGFDWLNIKFLEPNVTRIRLYQTVRFGLFSQSQRNKRFTPAKRRNPTCASRDGWVHLLSERYPAQKSASSPAAQFDYCRLRGTQHVTQKIYWYIYLAPDRKMSLFSDEGQAASETMLRRIMNCASKNSTYASLEKKRILKLWLSSKRLYAHMADLFRLLSVKKRWVKVEPDKNRCENHSIRQIIQVNKR